MPGLDMADPASLGGTMMEIVRQAEMVAYVGSFRAILLLAIVLAPLCLLLRRERRGRAAAAAATIHME